MRVVERLTVRGGQGGQRSGELSTGRRMDPLQEPPVRGGRERERLIGKTLREDAEQRTDGEVLVDDDHRGAGGSVVVFVGTTAEQRIRSADLGQ